MNNMSTYKMVPLTELLTDIIDNRGKSCPVSESGFPLIATNCIKPISIYPTFENIRYVTDDTLKNWFRAELKPNDILFVNKGTPGRVCLVPDPVTFCAAQDMVGLRADPEKIYYKYLFAILRSSYIQKIIANFHVGIAIPHFKKSDMNKLLIPVPNLTVQKKIGDIYCQLSEKIENNNKINFELESIAKTIYSYWFLQFEFPNREGKPYKSSGGKMVWSDDLKREIPEGWRVASLNDCVDDILDRRGVTPKKLGGDWVENGIKALSAKCIKNGKLINLDQANQVSEEMYKRWMTKDLQDGDILMTSEAPLGEFYFILNDEKFCLSQRLFAIRSNSKVKPIYLYYELSHGYGNSQIMGSKSGSTVFGIRQDELRKINILIPSEEIQEAFEKSIIDMYRRIRINDYENRELIKLREFLLPLLMNGQIGFKEE